MMIRKAILMGVALLLTGIMPVMAAASCVEMPCCHHKGAVVQQPDPADCCTPVTCAKEEQAVKNASPSQTAFIQVTVVIRSVVVTEVRIPVAHASIAPTSPPSTSERLSTLSILLI